MAETEAPGLAHPVLPQLRCQSCGSAQIRRTHRAGLKEKLLSLTGDYPYHCHRCQARSFLPARSLPEKVASEAVSQPIRRERKKSEVRRTQRIVLLFVVCGILFALFLRFFILRPPSDAL